jgi:predicted RNA-binding Zn ribbon-like protein
VRVDLDDYVGGATLATELVNTAPGVWHGEDQLDGVPALTRFLVEHGVATDHEPTVDDLEAVRALRAPVREAIEAGERPDGEADVAARAGALVARAGGPPSLTRDDGGRWRWSVAPRPDATLAERLALLVGVGLLGVVRVLDADRFRDCASPTCSGVFVDTSRAGRRRYCMPELCGNRAHVAAHRERRRAGTTEREEK